MKNKKAQVIAAYATDIITFRDFVNGYGAYYQDACVLDIDDKVYYHKTEYNISDYFNSLIGEYKTCDIVPVIMCEDLSRDFYFLYAFLENHKTKITAKNTVDILKIEIIDDGNNTKLIFWNTKDFFIKSMDYKETVEKRLFFLWDNFKNFSNLYDFIDSSDYGTKILTSTSVVRTYEQRKIYPLKGKNKKAGYYRYWLNQREKPQSDDMLYSIFCCNRGGFSFCNSTKTGVAFEFDNLTKKIINIDATSHYPAQIVSHMYPEQFEDASSELLECDAEIVKSISVFEILENWHEPFMVAFHSCFIVENVFLKENTFFAKNKIGTLPLTIFQNRTAEIDENFNANFAREIKKFGYFNKIFGKSEKIFNKLLSADAICIWFNELEWWIFNQVYDYTNYMCIKGYESAKFCKPADSSILSVMYFFDKKQEIKNNLNRENKQNYEYVKKDLNAIYGREVAVELYPTYELDNEDGVVCSDMPLSFEHLPTNNKTWMQFGQRVCGWGRVAQIVLIDILKDFDCEILGGDTDSLKLIIEENNLQYLQTYLQLYSRAIGKAKNKVCKRVYDYYDKKYLSSLDGIGEYKIDWISNKYYAARNKCYMHEREKHLHAVLSGVDGEQTLDVLAVELQKKGFSFRQICEKLFAPDFILSKNYGGKEVVLYPAWRDRIQTDFLDEKTGELKKIDKLAAPYRNNVDVNLWSSSKKDLRAELKQIEQNRKTHEKI